MQQIVCIEAHGRHVPGELVELPDDADWSPLHFAEQGSPEAAAAEAGRGPVSHSEPPATQSPAAGPGNPGAAGNAPGGGGSSPPSIPSLSLPGFSAPADKETT